jgi:hypothetical protein
VDGAGLCGRGVPVAAALALALTTCGAAGSGAAPADGWWVDRYVPETPRHLWLRLATDGDVEALALADDRVSEVRAGRLPESAARALRAAAERALAAPEAKLPPGLIPEGEILRLGGRFAGRDVARSWQPDVPGNEAARVLSAEAESAAARVPLAAAPAAYVRTRAVEPDRVAMLKSDGRLPFRSRAEAERVASVARALADPGRFVAVPSGEAAALERLAGGGTQVFVEDGGAFEIMVTPVTGR